MPCHSPEGLTDYERAKTELDLVTRLLCENLAKMEAADLTEMMSEETFTWWEKHKEWDRQRRAKEREMTMAQVRRLELQRDKINQVIAKLVAEANR